MPANNPAGPGNHEVTVYGGNGHGSVNTAIRRWTGILVNVGGAITLAQSATLGDSFTIAIPGMFEISYRDARSGSLCFYGISKNSVDLATAIYSLSDASPQGLVNTTGGNYSTQLTRVLSLVPGDVIRAHSDGTPNATIYLYSYFSIRRIGNA